MGLSQDRKNEISKKLVLTIADGLENDSLSAEQFPKIARFVIDGLALAQTEEDLVDFLRVLAKGWNIFTKILVEETGLAGLAGKAPPASTSNVAEANAAEEEAEQQAGGVR